jgi:hypothetical protein
MKTEYKIVDPGSFYYVDNEGEEWLGIDIGDCQLAKYDTIWVKSYRPHHIRQPPRNLGMDNSLRLTMTLAMQRLRLPPPGDPEMLDDDVYTVWFGLNVRSISKATQKNLSQVRFLLIPCNALQERKIPGFQGGCIP